MNLPSRGETELVVEVANCLFESKDQAFCVYALNQVQTNSSFRREVKALGSRLEYGRRYKIVGEWYQNPKYGDEFRYHTALPLKIESHEQITAYLKKAKIHGIGPKTIKSLVKKYGADLLEVAQKKPQKMIADKVIGESKLEALTDYLEKNAVDEDLQLFFAKHGISFSLLPVVRQQFGSRGSVAIQRNPYLLYQSIRGIGFKTCDQLALKEGFSPESPFRTEAGLEYLLRINEDDGHTFLWLHDIQPRLGKLLEREFDIVEVEEALERMDKAEKLVMEKDQSRDQEGDRDHWRVYRRGTFFREQEVASWIAERFPWKRKGKTAKLKGVDQLSEEQKMGVGKALLHNVFVLTGGPGVGKTMTSKALIDSLMRSGFSVALAAPTGRAAKRIAEVTGQDAKTIHRLLEYHPGENKFKRNAADPLEVDYLIVDECSMIDLWLFSKLLDAVGNKTSLVLIGDKDQLPPIGCGEVFATLCEYPGLPRQKLTKIFRQSDYSRIAVQAHALNQGKVEPFDNQSDCKFIEVQSDQQLLATIKTLLQQKLIPKYPHSRDIQILVPKKKGLLGTESLNLELKEIFNPLSTGTGIEAQDKVIQTINNYDLNVFNGDMGIVVAKEKTIWRIAFDSGIVEYPVKSLRSLELAYAITVHKSQGSEFPVVIVPLSFSYYVMLYRKLVYTALTRAKQMAIFIGQDKVLRHAVEHEKELRRQTSLGNKMTAFIEQEDG